MQINPKSWFSKLVVLVIKIIELTAAVITIIVFFLK